MTEKEALSKAMAYCAAGERCVSQMYSKLEQWGVETNISERTIHSLIREDFINEKRYAIAFTSDKFRFSQWGRQKIIQALNSIDQEEYLKTLNKIISAKRKTLKNSDEYQNNIKLIRAAVSKGFEIPLIRKTIPFAEE